MHGLCEDSDGPTVRDCVVDFAKRNYVICAINIPGMSSTPRRYGADPWFADEPSDIKAAVEMMLSVWDSFKANYRD